LVVCTDGCPEEDCFYSPLLDTFDHVLFLDGYLRTAPESSAQIGELPWRESSVLPLICQLVAASAEMFVGTLFSSFTALIQRARGFTGRDQRFLYCYADWDQDLVRFDRCEYLELYDGSFSWNRIRYPVDAATHSWMREWQTWILKSLSIFRQRTHLFTDRLGEV